MFHFSRKNRLVSKKDFDFVFAKPHKVTGKHLLLLYRTNQKAFARLGLMLSKRHIKSAVERNRWRRVIRESFRQHQAMLKGIDIIVLVRGPILEAKLNKKLLRQALDKLWRNMLHD